MSISSISIPISQKNTLSNSEITKEAYHFSILNYIKRILNNLFLRNYMHFEADIEASDKRELWHGTLWYESPLFDSATISYNDGKNNNIFKYYIYFIVDIVFKLVLSYLQY